MSFWKINISLLFRPFASEVLAYVYRSFFSRERVVALGEIGLDYSQNNHVDHEIQKRTFLLQVNMALERDLAVCLHIRRGTIHKLRQTGKDKNIIYYTIV